MKPGKGNAVSSRHKDRDDARHGRWWHPDTAIRRDVEHWRDWRELHDVMHKVPDQVRALLLELLDGPMPQDELES